MTQKVLKPLFLLMISWAVTGITFFGCNPIALAWYSAGNVLPAFGVVIAPVMAGGIYYYQGFLPMCKYTMIILMTYVCINLYKKWTKNPNPFILAGISVMTMVVMEGADFYMNNMASLHWSRFKMLTYIPIIMLNWSTTIIFAYGINKFMVQKKLSPIDDGMQNVDTEQVLKIAKAFKGIASKMQCINSEYNENFQNEYLENHINECVCSGCANSEIQYMERARLNYLWFSKMVETREAMASQFNEVSKIVEKFLRPAISEDLLTDRMAEKIQRKFREKKIYAKNIRVVKNEKEYIEVEFYAKKKKRAKATVRMMTDIISQMVGKRMRMVNLEYGNIPLEYGKFQLLEEVNFHTLQGSAKTVKRNEQVSGDNFTYLVLDKGQTFMSICDGMGSGSVANEYSGIIIDLLEQFMDSGLNENTILRLINSVLLTKSGWDISTTVDMGMIDLYSGTCRFLKSGAACTFIKRGNWVECIKSTSLPIGVLNEVDVETITKKLYDGDFVIMISDGIVESLQCDDKEKEMANVIMDIESNNPKEMALIIMNEAIKLSGGVPKDDMTVLVTGIWRKH